VPAGILACGFDRVDGDKKGTVKNEKRELLQNTFLEFDGDGWILVYG